MCGILAKTKQASLSSNSRYLTGKEVVCDQNLLKLSEGILRVGIVGAGLSGLVCAERALSHPGLSVEIFEKERDVGGLAGYVLFGGLKVAKTYHHVLSNDLHLQKELKRLNISIDWKKVKVAFYAKSKIYSFNGPLDLLRFEPLRFADRLRLGWLVLRAKYDDHLLDTSLKDWITSTAGENVFDVFVDPLISTYFGSSDNISAAYLANRWRMESRSANTLGYADFPRLIDEYRSRISSSPSGRILTGCEISYVRIAPDHVIINLGDKEQNFDAVVMTCPPKEAGSLLRGVPQSLLNTLKAVRYRGCLCAALRFEQKLSEYYWINILDKKLPFVACFEFANLGSLISGGLVYLVSYVDTDSALWQCSDQEVIQRFVEGLKSMFRSVPRIREWCLFRTLNGTPVYEVGYRNVDLNPFPRLYFAGVYRAFPEIRSSGPALRTGIETAERIVKDWSLGML